ncbi:MAG TPA: hypothetical protein VK623_08105 [Flavobacterium sp.]|nr:hypothetical protein [Flavobacterium sp.]
MDTKFTLTIPKPCTESWDNMTAEANGRFCGSSMKSVVDFTAMNAEEIQDYFILNQGKKICGRFQSEQLETLVIRIPENVLYAQRNFHKMFLLALLLAMGTTLFSCSDKAGNKQKIDKVEIVEDTGTDHAVLLGEPAYGPNDNLQVTTPPPPKTEQVKFKSKKKTTAKTIVPVMMGDVDITVHKDSVKTEPIINRERIPKTTTSEK